MCQTAGLCLPVQQPPGVLRRRDYRGDEGGEGAPGPPRDRRQDGQTEYSGAKTSFLSPLINSIYYNHFHLFNKEFGQIYVPEFYFDLDSNTRRTR